MQISAFAHHTVEIKHRNLYKYLMNALLKRQCQYVLSQIYEQSVSNSNWLNALK